MSLHCTLSKDKLHGETAREMGFACGNGLQTLHTSHCNPTSVQRDHFNILPPQPIHFHQIIIWYIIWLKTLYFSLTKLWRHATSSVTFQMYKMCFRFLCDSKTYEEVQHCMSNFNHFNYSDLFTSIQLCAIRTSFYWH